MPDQLTLPGIEPDDLPFSNHDPTHDCEECGCRHAAEDSREHGGQQYCPDCLHCPSCGCVFNRDDSREHDDERYCEDCVYSCGECEFTTLTESDLHSAYHSGFVIRDTNTSNLCDGCCWECHDCNRHFANSVDRHTNGHDDICERCAQNYTSCEECDATICTEDARQSCDRTLCRSCYSDAEEESTLIHDYGFKPSPIFQYAAGQIPRSQLMLGWELECDRRSAATSPDEDITESGMDTDIVYCKEDGSLKYGFEMVSHPGTWEFWNSFDWSFAPALASCGYRSYNTTTSGMHVHVSKSWLSEHDRYKLLLFFRSNHGLIFRLSRRASLDKLNAYASIDHDRKAALLRKAKKGDKERYRAINLRPEHTVEFRLFRGTLRPESIKRNLALVTMICHFAKHTSPGRVSDNDFLTYVMSHGAAIVGEPMATDLGNWVSEAVNGPCAADEGY